MSSSNLKKVVLLIVILMINISVLFFIKLDFKTDFKFSFDVISDESSQYQLFYAYDGNFGDHVINTEYKNKNDTQTLSFSVPRMATRLRIDTGSMPAKIELSNFKLSYFGKSIDALPLVNQDKGSMNDIGSFNINGYKITITSSGSDPFITMDLNGAQNELMSSIDKYIILFAKVILCIVIDLAALILFMSRRKIKELVLDIYLNRKLILNLSKNDFKTRFSGSYLGITWAFVQPIVVVVIYWFVFDLGFKSAPMNNFPFLLWLIAGIVPWFFFNEALLNATNSFLEYSYLVKKVVFKINILPVVKVLSAFYVHLFFIVFANIIYLLFGYKPQIYMIQSLYYSICVFVLVLGLSYITSSIVIFFKDLGQIVGILLQFGMWMLPIMYSEEMMPSSIRWILKINPMYYIVEGYRDTFIRHIWFWNRYNQTIYFWGVTLLIFTIGVVILKKLKPHFSDVL